MCGINGLIGFKDKQPLIRRMNDILKHRGPDAQGEWFDDMVALGHRRLSIIDLSSLANQPMVKDGLAVIYNGEVYNYQELRSDLLKKGITFISKSDTEVVLELFRQYREGSFQKLLGMFAFCIYDIKNKEIFLVRDYFGIKPLYYAFFGSGRFAFSSEIKAFLAIPEFSKEINVKSLVSSLNYLWIYGNGTIFKQINKLAPAHYLHLNLKVDLSNISIKRYWQLPVNKSDISEKSARDKLKEILESSIKRHLLSDVPVGAFLSGGLDSSLISVLAKKFNQDLTTYTISISKKDKKFEKMPDDNLYARKLADIFGINHTDMPVKPQAIQYLKNIVSFLDEPIGDPAAINTFLICKAARDKGIKVLLSGMGADEIFAGYRRHYASLLATRLSLMPSIFKNMLVKSINWLPVRVGNLGLRQARWAKRFMSFTDMPMDEAYMRSYSYYDRQDLCELLNHNYDDIVEVLYSDHRNIFNSVDDFDDINKMCNTDINMFLEGLNLTYTDRASMATSVEVRVPYIDREVVEFSMSISGKYKINKGTSKYILKQVANDYLPRQIVYRPKASFGMPIRAWISYDLKGMVNDILSAESIKHRGILNYAYIKKIIKNDRQGLQDNAYQIYQLLTLELWFREFIDGK